MPEWKQEIRRRLAGLKLEATREAEIVEELSQHLDDGYAELRASGKSQQEALRAALAELSTNELLARELRRVEKRVTQERVVLGAKRRNLMGDLWQDVRFGARLLIKSPGFTSIAVLTLALGIGANTAIFSVVNVVLLRPLPYPDADRLVMVWEKVRLPNYQNDQNAPAPGNFADWNKENSVFENMAAIRGSSFNLTGEGEPLRIDGEAVSAAFFSILKTSPMLGRAFTAEEDRFGGPRVVVLSHGLWSNRFAANPQILERSIALDGENYTVVGVMPAGFQFPDPEDELWVPIALSPAETANHGSHNLRVVARLNGGASLAQAQEQMNAIAESLTRQYPNTNTSVDVNLIPLHEQVAGNVRPALMVLLATTAFILLIVCANIANLQLARATVRSRELAIRIALGGSRSRIARQLLTESVLLALIGGALGLVLAYWGVKALQAMSPPDLPRVTEIGVNYFVLAFSLILSLVTGLIFGTAPAIQASRHDVQDFLKEGGRGTASGSRVVLRNLLVAVETALGVMVLIGAGLLVRSFIHLGQVRLGFEPKSVLTLRVALDGNKYSTPSQRSAFYEQAIENIEALPGVTSASAISSLPLTNARNRRGFAIEGRAPLQPGQLPFGVFRTVAPRYFQTMQIPMMEGRDFSWRDTPESVPVIVINQAMAKAYWPDQDSLGKRIKFGSPESAAPWLTIVGIVEDVREFEVVSLPLPTMYIPLPQDRGAPRDFVLRSTGDALGLASAVRSAIWSVDKSVPVSRVQMMENVRAASVASQRFNLALMAFFGCLALALATTGLYGVTAYSVAQRTREIGIRLALGAQSTDVLGMVLRQGLRLVVIGVGVGIAGAFALTRLMSSLLFEVSASDPLTFVTISLLLAGVALLACYVPARRAMKVDPIVALRYE